MKKLIIVALFTLLPACASAPAVCNFFFNQITNGANVDGWDRSFWNCLDNQLLPFGFTIFDNGVGDLGEFGVFTWEETGCGEASLTAATGDGSVNDLDGSRESQVLTGNFNFPGLTTGSFSCFLDQLPE